MNMRAFGIARIALLLFFVFECAVSIRVKNDGEICGFEASAPTTVLKNINFTVTLVLDPYFNSQVWPNVVTAVIRRGNENGTVISTQDLVVFEDGSRQPNLIHSFPTYVISTGSDELFITIAECTPETLQIHAIPGWLSIIPPVVTIFMAVAFRQVYVALITGMLVGTTFLCRYNVAVGFLRLADTYMVNAFAQTEHATIICITFLLGALIGLVQKCGGGMGLANLVTKFATNPRRAELACFGLGCCIFFDDYCSILIVGNSMRTVMKQVHVSSENFAFIVHCVGVAVSSFCPISSWVGVQVGYIASSYKAAGQDVDSFMVFLNSIQYRFFPILMLVFVFILIVTQKHFGPMYKAARDDFRRISPGMDVDFDRVSDDTDGLAVKEDAPLRWYNAAIPFGFVVIATFLGMVFSGIIDIKNMPEATRVSLSVVNVFSHTNSLGALLWSSLAGCIVAIILVVSQKIFTVHDSIEALMYGIKEVLEPTIVMVLAWGLGLIMADLSTGPFLSSVIGNSINPNWMPCLVLLLTYMMCFATGSAFGTMGILFPLVVPVVLEITDNEDIRLQCVSAILGGGAFANIASPIADDTILASVAVGIDLHQHTKTHLPYVLIVALLSFVTGFLPLAIWPSCPSWLLMVVSTVMLIVITLALGNSPYSMSSFHKSESLSQSPLSRFRAFFRGKDSSGNSTIMNNNAEIASLGQASVTECTRLLDEQHFDGDHIYVPGGVNNVGMDENDDDTGTEGVSYYHPALNPLHHGNSYSSGSLSPSQI